MLFSPGPTEIEMEMRQLIALPMPYFRAQEYATQILALSEDFRYLLGSSQTPLILTASGTGTMEMAIQNLTEPGERVVTLNGGTFGHKWTVMCRAFGLEVEEVVFELGHDADMQRVEDALKRGVRALFTTAHETSTGQLYDSAALARLAAEYGALTIVDAVSSIGADPFEMREWGVDCTFVSSQKALACAPGISVIAFSEAAEERLNKVKRHRCYFDARDYLNNAARGIIPFTPALPVTLQLRERLRRIRAMGLERWIELHTKRAEAFRHRILANTGFGQFAQRPTRSMSAISLPPGASMSGIVAHIYERYGWYLAPNPTQVESYIRVSHMGALSVSDLELMADRIVEAATEMSRL